MRKISILIVLGGLVCLIAPQLLPMATIDEADIAVHGYQMSTGQLSLFLSIVTMIVGAISFQRRKGIFGAPVAVVSMLQIALMAWTYAKVWHLVPCGDAALGLCDGATGRLLEGALVTLDLGQVAVILTSLFTLTAGLWLLVAPREFTSDERFLHVVLKWGGQVLSERVFHQPQTITVGEADDNTLQLAAAGLSHHTLLQPIGPAKYHLLLPRGVQAKVVREGQVVALDGEPLDFSATDCGTLQFDHGLEIALAFVGAETQLLAQMRQKRDSGLWVSLAAVAAATLVFVTAALLAGRTNRDRKTDEDLAEKHSELIEIAMELPTPPEPTKPAEELKIDDKGPSKRPENTEGRAGDPAKTRETHVANNHTMTKTYNIQNSTLLRALNAPVGAIATVLSGDRNELTTKIAQTVASGQAEYTQDGNGSNGMGFRGTGPGGGDLVGPGKIGGTNPFGDREGIGRDAKVGPGKKITKRVPIIKWTNGEVNGGCDTGDIAKNVRSRGATIRSCYEIQLMNSPNLSGKVTARWTIQGDGTTANAKVVEDSVGGNAVSDCVLRALSHIRFAAPQAGVCVVQWPFVFTSGQ